MARSALARHLARYGSPGDPHAEKLAASVMAVVNRGGTGVVRRAAPRANPVGDAFRACVAEQSARGAYDPRALCAYIGRRKYGAQGFQAMAAAGKRRAKRRR